jgi:hypothetical protein
LANVYAYNFSDAPIQSYYDINPRDNCSTAPPPAVAAAAVARPPPATLSTSGTKEIMVQSTAGAGPDAGAGATAPTEATPNWDWMLSRRRRLAHTLGAGNSSDPPGLMDQLATWLAGRVQPAAAVADHDASIQEEAQAGGAAAPGFRSRQVHRRRLM